MPRRRSIDIKLPSAILTADWHIRTTCPICRKDDYWEAQIGKLAFIKGLLRKHKCPMFLVGDIFDRGISNPQAEIILLDRFELEDQIFCIAGQHDLINHKIGSWRNGSLGVIESAEIMNISWTKNNPILYVNGKTIRLHGIHYGEELGETVTTKDSKNVLLLHTLVSQKGPMWKDDKSPTAKQILKKYPQFDLIVVGDNHQSFVVKYKGRILVNPGSLLRTTINQINHKPRVYLWYAEDNTVEDVFIPIKQDVMVEETIHTKRKEDQELLSAQEKERKKA